MATETTQRQLVKKQKEAGALVVEILHPLTEASDPNADRPTNEAIQEAIISGDFNGYKTKIALVESIEADLANAQRVYALFGIEPESETALADLTTAINAYESTATQKDTTELNNEIILATVQALKNGDVSAENIKNSYVRTSAIAGVISLEKLADYLGVEYTGETTDTALADLVKVALTS